MEGYQFIDKQGTFQLKNPELTSYLYFPIANESGVMSCVTPSLGGDNKTGQNTFLLEPVSSENLHNNKSTRNFWCNINDQIIWSATGKSSHQEGMLFSKEKEETLLEAGIMWHKVKREAKEVGISSEIVSFVPYTDHQVEVMMVTIQNIGRENLEVVPTAAIPIYGRSADNIRDHRNVTSMLHRIKTTDYGVIVNPTLTFDERGHQKNKVCYGVIGSEEDGTMPEGFFPSVEEFIGEGGSFENPKAVYDGTQIPRSSNEQIDGYEAMGALQFRRMKLLPQEKRTYIILLAYSDNKEEMDQLSNQFSTVEKCSRILEETKVYWEDKINIAYKTGDQNFDSWMHWVNFQPMLRRIYGCSFLPHHDYGRGGRGWRDLWQDCLALMMMNPKGVRDMLLSNYGGVRMDGTNATIIGTKPGEFFADRNNITRVWMDHGVWPFLTTHLYIMQSGDIDLLLISVPYFKDSQGYRGEERDFLWSPEEGNLQKTKGNQVYYGTVLEHILIQHLTAFYDVGEHNHIRLRGADWNDALDMARERGESVAFTALYGSNLEQLADLILQLEEKGVSELQFHQEMDELLSDQAELYESVSMKKELLRNYCTHCHHSIAGKMMSISPVELANNLRNKGQWIKKHIQTTEWVQSETGHAWYNGYYDEHGRSVEGDHDLGVRMMLTSQVFAIMSKIATDDQVSHIVEAADTYLYEKSMGGYRLNTNFYEVKEDLGRMFGFAYGHKENGAVFSHMTIMYANALYQRGYAKEGYKAINSLYRHCIDFERSKIYPGIPEYIGSNGRGLYHYLTGSASWLLLTVLTEMFGVKGELGNLKIEPKLMLEQFDQEHKAEVEFVFAQHKLRLRYLNVNCKEFGSYKIGTVYINEIKYHSFSQGNVIRKSDLEDLAEGMEHCIEVELI